jgi:hypothetical protein
MADTRERGICFEMMKELHEQALKGQGDLVLTLDGAPNVWTIHAFMASTFTAIPQGSRPVVRHNEPRR